MQFKIISQRAATLASALLLSACASKVTVVDFYEASSSALLQYQQIDTLETAEPPDSFEALEDIEGLYCRKSRNQTALTDRWATLYAIDQLRLKAAEQGADAITEPACTINTESDFSNNCYGNVICRATALRHADR